MERPDPPARFDDATSRLIRRKAAQLARRPEFRQDEHDDVAHDIIVALLSRLQRFGGTREDLERILNRLVKQIIANLVRDRQAGRRNPGELRSLDERLRDALGESVSLADTLTPAATDARTGRAPTDPQQQVDLAITLAEVLDGLPHELRTVADLLQFHSKAEAARWLGIPRTTLCSALAGLRAEFERAGLRKFL